MTFFTVTCAFVTEIAKTFRMIIIHISRLLKKMGGRPPVGLISELFLIGYETSAVGGGGKSTLGISPQNQTLVPPGPLMTSVSTCLLFMTLGRSKGSRQQDAFTLCLWDASLLWWDGKLSGVSGTPSAARPDRSRECVGQRHRAVERWSRKGGNLSFEWTLLWPGRVGSWWFRSAVQQQPVRRFTWELNCPEVNDRCIFLQSTAGWT